MSIAILIDSTGDFNKELRDRFGIDGYCEMHVSFKDNGVQKEIAASLDWDQGYTPEALYAVLDQGERLFTSQVTRQEFEKQFSKYLDEGRDVLYIGCSSGLSKSVELGSQIAKELLAKSEYKGRRIAVVDSLISGYAQGYMGAYARKLENEGMSLNEIEAWLNENRLRFNQFAAVANLKYLKMAGRVSASSAFFGNLFGVKPILISDTKGMNFAVKKIKGRKASLEEIAKDTVEATEDIENAIIFIGHICDEEGAKYAKEEILKLATPKEIIIGSIGPIIGASCGRGVVSCYTFGKAVTIAGE